MTSLFRTSMCGLLTFMAMTLSTMPLNLDTKTPIRAQPRNLRRDGISKTNHWAPKGCKGREDLPKPPIND